MLIKWLNKWRMWLSAKKLGAVLFIGYYVFITILVLLLTDLNHSMEWVMLLCKTILFTPIAIFVYKGKQLAIFIAMLIFIFELITILGAESFPGWLLVVFVIYCIYTIKKLAIAYQIESKQKHL